ncbi:uncharacterized protein JCM6883_007390 [Sporobolomyces salmoneus]|uniref:uncharacterized protein n=1 Tax=Sporobolomyces salmoneus TaxID=183962 RepID=UPI00317FC0B8
MPKVSSSKSSSSKSSKSSSKKEDNRSEVQIAYAEFVKEMTAQLKTEKPNQKGSTRRKEINSAWKASRNSLSSA